MAYTGYPDKGWRGNGKGGYAQFRFYIEPTYNASGGTYGQTTVKVKLQVMVTGEASYLWPYIVGEGAMTYGGSTHTFSGNSYSIKPSAKESWATVQYSNADAEWTKTVNHDADGAASITLGLSGIKLLYSYNNVLYYISLGTYSTTVNLDQNRTYTLTIDAGAGSAITVTRSGAALENGAKIVKDDVLTVTFAANSGYTLATHKLNGSTFTSGNTHTVAGDVAVTATATANGHTLTISPGANSSITVKKNGTTLSSGDTVYTGDVLSIKATASTGYNITAVTVNGEAIANDSSFTVGNANVTVASTASQNPPVTTDGGVWIYANGAWAEYQAYIYVNGAWVKYAPYIYTSNGWVKY